MIGSGVVLCVTAILPAVAFANAANPCGSSATAGVCPPTNAGPSGTETINADGTATITVRGLYSWLSQTVQAGSQDNCGGHYGVGWGLIWNDPKDAGFTVAKGSISEGVGSLGNTLNPADEAVHYNANDPCGSPTSVTNPAHPGQTVTIPVGMWGPGTAACLQAGSSSNAVPPCPPTPGHTGNTGATLPIGTTSHVYATAADVPAIVCVNMYDLHQPFSSGNRNYVVDKNGDNSIETNAFNPAIGGGSCFSPVPRVEVGTLVGHIYSCANGQPTTTEVPGGTISSSGNLTAADSGTGVTFANLTPGNYPASAVAPSGSEFVTCGSSTYTVGTNGGSASYTNPVSVPANGTGTAIFYVIPAPPPPPTANCYPLKTVTPTGAVASGTVLTYTVKAIGNGATAGPCVISDLLSVATGASFANPQVSAPSAGTVSGAIPDLTWTISSLGVGATESLQMSVTVNGSSNQTGEVTNAATAIQGCTATGAHPCAATVRTPIPPPAAGPDCSPAKTVSPTGSVTPGTVLTYTISVTNHGGAGACSVTDALSATGAASFAILQNTLNTSAGTVTFNGSGWTWNLPSIAMGGIETLTVDVQVFGIGTVTNTATAPPNACSTPPCSSTVSTPLTLALTKTVTPTGSVLPGTSLVYTISLTNTSDNDVTTTNNPSGITVDDVMRGTAGFVVDTASFAGSPPVTVNQLAAGHFQWKYTSLAHGASAVVTFSATITTGPGSVSTCLLGGAGAGTSCLDNTASTAGPPPVTVENSTLASGVLAARTPSTGALDEINIGLAGFLFLGGLTLILLGLLVKMPGYAPRRAA